MLAEPRLVPIREPTSPLGAVLVLHGGASRQGRPPVSPTQLSVIRMIPTARAAARAGRGRLAVYRLLNSYRGWDTEHTPVNDAIWALQQIAERYDGLPTELPVGLIGHSLGGRAALLAGTAPAVTSVVALNPWVYEQDAADLAGRQVLIVHGMSDRIAAPARSEAVARRIARTTDVGYLRIPEGKHAMLRHGGDFDRYAAEFTAARLAGDVDVSDPVARVLQGEEWVTA